MNRILIDAPTFQTLLEKNPEIEIELMRNVPEKIAEELSRKLSGKLDEIVNEQIKQETDRIGGRYGFPDGAKIAIRNFLREQYTEEAKLAVWGQIKVEAAKSAESAAKAAVEKVAADHKTALDKRIKNLDGEIKTIAEREVLALLRGLQPQQKS